MPLILFSLQAGAVALSSFIQALVELDYVGVTRRIYNKNYDPVMGVLYPEFKENYEVCSTQFVKSTSSF